MKNYLFMGFSTVFLASALLGKDKAQPSDSMKDCPMHEQHAADNQHDHAMNERGDKGMGFSQDKTMHHFLISKDGGAIVVTANTPDDQTSVQQIRMHLKQIAKAFQSGDFDIPMFVHDQTPPGVPVIQELKNSIIYKYEDTQNGGRVVMRSTNAEAVAAIAKFLCFQIKEHKTGDPI